MVGDTVKAFAHRAWTNPEVLAEVNYTDICLIPKVPKPELFSQFKPISLCNVNYKILTKIIVNRLKPFIPRLVSPCQAGFVPGRSIHENIVVAQKMVHSMAKIKGKTSFFVIKVDLAKAYDRLRWSFIHDTLTEIGLPRDLILLIMHGITSVKTNVLWNGSRSPFFPLKGGFAKATHCPLIFLFYV